jgi:crotonobetainyl-CoA:carnitine CoA-transferase CaiB-like acyl-CoA transferase
LKDRKWLDGAEREKNIDHIIEILEKWTRNHRVNELVEPGQLMHFPWANVASIPEIVNDPQLKARGFLVEAMDTASGKPYKYPGAPFKMSRSPWQINSQKHRVGEYNYEIYHNRLGLTETAIGLLSREGVI